MSALETIGGLEGSVPITQVGIDRAERLLQTRSARIGDEELRKNVEVIVHVLFIEVENDEAALSPDDRRNITADLQDRLKVPSPSRGIIKSGLERVRNLWPALVEMTTVAANLATVLRGW